MAVCCFADVLYVATCNPVALYSMREHGDTIQYVDLYDIFPKTISGVWQPCVTIAPLGIPLDGQVVLHEEQVGTRPKTISYRCINRLHPRILNGVPHFNYVCFPFLLPFCFRLTQCSMWTWWQVLCGDSCCLHTLLNLTPKPPAGGTVRNNRCDVAPPSTDMYFQWTNETSDIFV